MSEVLFLTDGIAVVPLCKGSNFTIRISRQEAIRLLWLHSPNCPEIMCKEYGDDDDWVGITLEDMITDNDCFEYQTFELWVDNKDGAFDNLPDAPPDQEPSSDSFLRGINKQLANALAELVNCHINNVAHGVTGLDFSEKDYAYINDDIDTFEVNYLGNVPGESDNQQNIYIARIMANGNLMTDAEAYRMLSCRLNNTNIYN